MGQEAKAKMMEKLIEDGPFPTAKTVGCWNSVDAGGNGTTEAMPLHDGSGWVLRTMAGENGVALCFVPRS